MHLSLSAIYAVAVGQDSSFASFVLNATNVPQTSVGVSVLNAALRANPVEGIVISPLLVTCRPVHMSLYR